MPFRFLVRLWIVLAGLALAQPAVAQQADRLAKALALPTASGLVGARDAARFAWVETAAGVRNIRVATRGAPARRLTAFKADDGQLIYHLALANDGSRLAFVRGGDDEYPDEPSPPNTATAPLTPPQRLFVVGWEGGTPRDIGEGHSPVFSPTGDRLAFTRRGELWVWTRGGEARRIAKVRGEVGRLSWSPDGTQLLFAEDRGDHGYVALIDATGERLRYLDPGASQAIEPVFSPDGREVAFIRYRSPPAGTTADDASYWSLRVVDVATRAGRALWTAPPGDGSRYAGTRSRNLFWSRSGQLVFPWERSGWLHAYAIDGRLGGEPRALTAGSYEVETFLVDDARDALLYAANTDHIDSRRIWRRPLGGGVAVRLGQGAGMHFFPTLGGSEVAAIATSASSPAHPVLLGSKSTTALAEVPIVANYISPEAVTFKAADGVEVRGQLFRARGAGRRPALVFIHGGPRRQMLLGFHPSGYYSKTYVMNQHLAALGYHVLAVNYRGGTGYGQAFREAPETGREGASEYRDVLAAGRWLAARDDVSGVGAWGGSWGGYLTALALARDSELFLAGVDLHGVHSMLRPLANTLSPEAQERARQLQWDSSPLGAIGRWRSPVLLIHGDDDRNVDFAQTLLLARELTARGIPYRELVFPNERHSFFLHQNWLEALRATEDFLDLTLKRRQPLP